MIDSNSDTTKLLLFGAGGNGAAHLAALKPHVKMLGFIDNDPEKTGTYFCGHPVYSPDALHTLSYDKIVIASSWALDITHQLLRQLSIPREKVVDYTLNLLHEINKKKTGNYNLITGNSYAVNAYHEGCFEIDLVNLALSSQDIKTDLKLLKRFFQVNQDNAVKYVFITLYHYVFDYDRTMRKDLHPEDTFTFLVDENPISNPYQNLFRSNLNTSIRDTYSQKMSQAQIENAANDAAFRSAKCYPATRKKNLAILEEMITLSSHNNAQPIFVIPPMHSAYLSGLDKDHLSFFYKMVKNMAAKFNIPLLDCLNHPYPRKTFGDPTHLNRLGASMFSLDIQKQLRRL